MTTDRDRFIADLHEVADFLASHPAVPLPYLKMLNAFCETREELATVARCATWTKDAKGGYFYLSRPFGSFRFDVNIAREKVCRRIVTGQVAVPAKPAEAARMENVYTWECDESLLASSP